MVCVKSVSVCPKSIALKVGEWSYVACADVCPLNADCKEVRWHSENVSVASVNAYSGYIFANAVGTTRIYATATDGSACTDYLTVTVGNVVPVTSVTLYRSSISLEEGHSVSVSAMVCPDNATNKNVTWKSSDNDVATVNNGVITAVSKGTAKITATAADGSGYCDFCTVTVNGDVLVTNISVSPLNKSLTVGGTCYLQETVMPSNATNKNVSWSSSNDNVATVNPNSGLVTAQGVGTATIYATAQDGSGKQGTCTISVSAPIAVTYVCVSPKQKTLSINETTTLYATVYPYGANSSVVWESSNSSVATVGTHTGIVTPISKGTTTITATSVSGNKTDACTITVDPREKVLVKKDSHSFYVEFADGKIWKNIGIDLSNREENYESTKLPNMSYDNYDKLIKEEQRYFDNVYVEQDGKMVVKNKYSVKQIAYLYLLDPLGIEYFMRHHACEGKDIASGEFLSYKDEVYEAIFGDSERLSGQFYFKIVDDNVQYGHYYGWDRMDVYSNAEVIFGSHTIFNWDTFWQSIGKAIFENIPVISHVLLGVEIYQALFYSGSIVGAMSGVASEFLDDYAKETQNTVLEKMLGWPNTIFSCFTTIVGALVDSFELNNLKDMDIYAKIQEQDYITVFDRNGSELTIQEIISKCTNG